MNSILSFNDSYINKQINKNLFMLNDIINSTGDIISNDAGSHSTDLEQLLTIAKKVAQKLDLSECVDISALDNIHIPVYSITCKDKSTLTINYNNGKGITKKQAMASAYMEYIERQSSRRQPPTNLTSSYYDLCKKVNSFIVRPSDLITTYTSYIADTLPLNWTVAVNLLDFRTVLLPTISVLYPYNGDAIPLFKNNTNGLASGTTFLEAIVQGIYEVIERDCASIAMSTDTYRNVDINSIDSPKCQTLIKEFQNNSIDIYIKDISNELGIPCFSVSGDDLKNKNSLLLCGGHGCHSSKEIALIRALTEMEQARKTILYGKREDIKFMRPSTNPADDYIRIKRKYKNWFSNSNSESYKNINTFHFENLKEELNWLISNITSLGFSIFAVNLSTFSEIPVVRVIIPGLENWNENHERIGQRIYSTLQKKHNKS